MAKRSMVEEKRKRIKLSKKLFFLKEKELKDILKSDGASIEDKLAASEKLQNYLAILVYAELQTDAQLQGDQKDIIENLVLEE